MTIGEYLNRAEEICKLEFMNNKDLVDELDIAYNTFLRIKRTEKCSSKVARRIKKFVDDWEIKHKGYHGNDN